MNLAVKITVCRMMLIPVMAVFFFVQFPYHMLVTALVFILAACTDFIDGHIARSRNMVTTLGKFLDPIADKTLVVVAFFMIVGGNFLFNPRIIGIICCSIIMCRELIIDMFRLVAAEKGAVIAAGKLGKIKTIVTDVSLPMILCDLHVILSYIGWALFVVATVLTVVSGLNYVLQNKQIFGSREPEPPEDKIR